MDTEPCSTPTTSTRRRTIRPVSMLCLVILASIMGGDGYSVASEKLSTNSFPTDLRPVYVPQDNNSSRPEEHELKKPGSKRWIWWYTVHMAAESMEQKLEFRRSLEDLKERREKTKDKRVWWYEVSEAMDKLTGKLLLNSNFC